MDLNAELSYAAKKVLDKDWPPELKALAWDYAYDAYQRRAPTVGPGWREWCEYAESRANRFWPLYVQDCTVDTISLNEGVLIKTNRPPQTRVPNR